MSESNDRTVVTVEIAGEEYTIRTEATPDYTRECAAFVNRTIDEIARYGSVVEAHKATMLAALALTDQLLQARSEVDRVRDELADRARKLTGLVQAKLGD